MIGPHSADRVGGSRRRDGTLRRGTVLALLAMAGLVGGCASVRPAFESPTVRLTGVRLVSMGISEQQFELDLAVSNPNAIALPIGGVDYALDFAGQRFAGGSTTAPLRVPAGATETLSLSVRTDLLSSARSLQSLLLNGDTRRLDYALSGAVRLDLPLTRPLPFRQTGTVALSR